MKSILKKSFKLISFIFISGLVVFFILNFIFPLKSKINYSQIVTASDGTIIHAFLSSDEKWRMITEDEDVSPQLEKAILFKEDRWYYYHPGINPFAILRAASNNMMHLQRTSGASTITMQLARLLYPKERTYWNKIVEMFRAVQLELNFSKKEILKMYLTLVPYGGNIEGVKAASLLYFGRLPGKLSIAQLATLSVVPNRPNALTPGRKDEQLLAARNKWLRKMGEAELFNDADIMDALTEPIQAIRTPVVSQAPHFSIRMHSVFPDVPVIHTSLNRINQQKISSITYNYNKRTKLLNIRNASVIVINNKTGRVEAYVGSPDMNDLENSGQVDGVTAIRSPGSAIKPFLYALAFDKGLVTPKSIVADVPVDFDGYAPENFNTKFNGNITVEHALSNSLNIPAVRLLSQLGVSTFTDKLKQCSFAQISRDEKKLGLSAVLGGCGVTLEELTSLYASFAHEGKFSPIRWLNDTSGSVSVQAFSPASSFMISEILSTLTRPDLPNNYQSSIHVSKIAWKTGTSYGRRDAWSIGYNPDFTVGVWVGNFSGEGVPELTGADIATPLLFEIFNSIDYNSSNRWFVYPEDLDFRLVCTQSGNPPEEFCEHQVIDYFIPGISSNVKCTHLKKIFVSPDESYSYCTACLPGNGYKIMLFPDLKQEVLSYYENEKIVYRKIPPHNHDCSRIFTSHPPVITSPINNKEYLVGMNDGQQIMLSCNPDNEVSTVYWYINDRFYKSCLPGEHLFFTPGQGKLKISCSDDKGRNTDILISVQYF